MSKEYIVVTIDRVRTTYIVPADSEDEARQKIEHPEQSYHIDQQEFDDLERIESIKENV